MALSSVQDLIDAEAKRRQMRDAEMRQGFQSSASQLADAAGLAYKIEGDKKAEAFRLRKADEEAAQRGVENARADAEATLRLRQANETTAQRGVENEREAEALRLKKAQDERQAGMDAQAMAAAQAKAEREAQDRARAQATEALGLIDPTKLPDDVDATALIDAAGAKAGFSPAESRQLHREIWTKTANAEDAAKLAAAAKQSEIDARKAATAQGWRALQIQAQKAKDAAEKKDKGDDMPDTRTRTKSRQLATATGVLDEIERTAKAFEEATDADAIGRITGKIRGKLTGYVPGLNESERTAFLANAEALNAMLFPILGREDAPTETEVKRLTPLMIGGETTPAELAAKLTTLRRLLTIQSGTMPGGQPVASPAPAPAAAPPASPRPSGSDFAKR
jgi:hypothetical protein